MKCPHCCARSEVLETRGARRRRQCANGHRYTTVEVVAESKASATGTLRHQVARQLFQLNDDALVRVRLNAARATLREKGYLR